MQPKVYTPDDHHIREEDIDPDALFVLKRLAEAGHEAYLVGGGVRDLLMHRKPKDFDISTSARPEEVKRLFRRCFLIGRRFRLAHVRFGEKIIEVATFRSGDPGGKELIVRDNEWGSAETDALRRDFTLNGLYYEAGTHRIIDYCNGFHDLNAGLLRVIGQPEMRFRQDPVRMIRLLKFRARFGLEIDPNAMQALRQCCGEILKASPARLLEEMLRMLESGAAESFLTLMQEHHLLRLLFPLLSDCLRQKMGAEIYELVRAADHMIRSGEVLERAALVGALLYPLLDHLLMKEYNQEHKPPSLTEIQAAAHRIVQGSMVEAFTGFPRRLRTETASALQAQYRFTPLTKRRMRPQALLNHPDFPEALQLLRIRALADESLVPELQHWLELAKERPSIPKERPNRPRGPRRRRSRR